MSLDERVNRSRLTSFALLIGWLLSLGAVYVLGLFTAFAFHRAPGAGEEGLTLEDRALAVTMARYLDQPVDWQALKSGEGSGPVPEQVQALIFALDREPDAERRALAAEHVAAAYPARKVAPAIQQILPLPLSVGRSAALAALFERWGRIDGRSALDFCRTTLSTHPLQERFLQAALGGWGSHRPEAAWQWVARNGAGPHQSDRYAVVLRNANDLPEEVALAWLDSLENRILAEEVAAAEAVRRLHSEGARSAFTFAEAATSDLEGRIALLSEVLEAWAAEDLQNAIRWFDTLPEEDRAWALVPIARAWTRTDPPAALRWLGGQPTSAARTRALRDSSRQWIDADGPAPLGEFLNSAEDLAAFSPAIEILALETMTVDPETAFSWSTLVADPMRRRYTASMVATYWMGIAPDDAAYAVQELLAAEEPELVEVAAEEPAATEQAPAETEIAPANAATEEETTPEEAADDAAPVEQQGAEATEPEENLPAEQP